MAGPGILQFSQKVVFTKIEGCSFARTRSINFSNFPYICL